MDSHEVRQEWAERSGEFSPTYYAHYGPDATSERVRTLLTEGVGREASVLEVGCSSGRHLAALHEAGFTDLTGIDVNADALDVLAETYPDLAATGEFHAASLESSLPELADNIFDAVFSVETLQHIHPDAEWVFEELARVTGEMLVTVENESGPAGTVNEVQESLPLYYRDWERVFTDLGLQAVESMEGKRDTVRVFRQPE